MAGISYTRTRTQYGFTLIEAAVVLVIIGFLLAAVLQGQQMIASARYKALMRDIGDYREAFENFRDRYNALPGDYGNADDRFDLTGTDGDGDGVIDNGPDCDANSDESCRAWQHLRGARLLNGDKDREGPDASPEHAFQGRVAAFFTGTQGNGEFGHKLLIEDVPPEFAIRMDDDLDDGIHNSGWISCLNGCSGDWPDVDGNDVDIVHAL